VAAHPQPTGVVEEDHAGGGAGLDGRGEEGAHDRVVTPRLADHRTAERVLAAQQVGAAFGHRGAVGKGPALDDDAGGLTLGVRVDDLDPLGPVESRDDALR
jgi:hypothetical protein